MTTPASDYAAAVAALRAQTLPAYVSYSEEAYARGIGSGTETPTRITVDTRTNNVVARSGGDAGNTPPTKRIFEPKCYDGVSEHSLSWNGRETIAIDVRRNAASCNGEDDVTFNVIYADPATMQLLGADGSETDEGVTVDFSVHYGRFDRYIMPTSLQAHAHGHGWLFWVRERAEVTYSNYSFDQVRRQSP